MLCNGDSLKKLISVVETHQTGKIVLVLGSTGNKGVKVVAKTLASSSINTLRFKSFSPLMIPTMKIQWPLLMKLVATSIILLKKLPIVNEAIKAAMAITNQELRCRDYCW